MIGFYRRGIAYLIADLLIFGADLNIENRISGVVFTLAGLLMLSVGIYLFRKIEKEATIVSLLFILCGMTGIFLALVILKSRMWVEFLCLTIVSAVLLSHFTWPVKKQARTI